MTVDDIRKALAPTSDGGRGPLLNQSQVAARLGVGAPLIDYRRRKGIMPEPVAYDGKGAPLWLPEQID